MCYSTTLDKMRNDIHRDIVQEATVRNLINNNDCDGILKLKEPLFFGKYEIHGVCCETGLLVSEDYDRVVSYKLLTIEELVVLHNTIVEDKNYSFTPNTQLV